MSKVNDHQQANQVYSGKFKITKQDLVDIAAAGQERSFSEEIDILEQRGGENWLEQELFTNFQAGLKCDRRQPLPTDPPGMDPDTPGDLSDFADRESVFSSNQKPPVPLKGFFLLLFEALNDFTLKILIVAAIVSMTIEMAMADAHELPYAWIEGVAILSAVVVCSLVTAINDYQKEKQFQVLNKVADDRKKVTVVRNGQDVNIHQDLVMTGDIVKLTEGMEIPADGIVLNAADLTTDESAMTGETDPVKKNALKFCISERDRIIGEGGKNLAGKHDVPSPLIMSGTRILTGEGVMVVIVVGDSSCLGKIAAILRQKEESDTPLQVKLTKIAEDIGQFGLYSAIAIVIVLLIRFTIERISEGEFDTKEHINEMIKFFIIGITVVVVAIPEGLPLAVTLSLAFSVKKMLKDQNLVRKLQACETMGGANNICSDKTGTLTKNVMTLVSFWNIDSIDFPDQKTYNLTDYMGEGFEELFLVSTAINSSATLHPEEKGSKTETAILKFLMKTPHDYRNIRSKYEEIRKFPFSSARKRMSTIINFNGKQVLLVKGASEMILRCCTKWHNKQTQQVENIDSNQLQVIEQAIFNMANKALRTICLAYKELNGTEDLDTKDHLGVYNVETVDLTLIAVFGIADIVRPEVPGAVQQCFDAGIKVRMVTGDNKDTARAIAVQCKIIDPNNKKDLVLEGPEFIKLTGGVVCKACQTFECDCPRDAETAQKEKKKVRVDTIKNGEKFDEIWPNLCVMARSRPEDKYALVTGLIERHNLVAVTGDGTNDAPALKKADVGFAMGIAGTEVAREASDIILLDDNFNSIVKAVLWGRNIYDSIKKFLQFQLTVNVVAVTITLIGAAIIKQEVLTPIQMLWVNLIMDTFASLALATEPPHEDLLKRKPHNRREYIVSKKMSKHIFGQSILQLIIIAAIVFGGEKFLPEPGSDSFRDDIPKKIEEYTKDMSAKEIADNEGLKYLNKYPYKYIWQTTEEKYCVSGRLRSYSGLDKEYYHIEEIFFIPSRHFTFVFNVFVLMQVFNFLNARKLNDEFNIFEGLTKNIFFPVIVLLIFAFQVFIISIGGKAFHCFSYWGLTFDQWLICLGFGVLSNFMSVIIKFVPEDKIFTCAIYENAGGDEDEEDAEAEFDENQPLQQNQQIQVQTPVQQAGLDLKNKDNQKQASTKEENNSHPNGATANGEDKQYRAKEENNESYAKQAPEENDDQQYYEQQVHEKL